MSLFGGKTTYHAYAGSGDVFDVIPDTLESSILQSSIEGGTKAEAVRWTIGTDQFARVKAAMRYARRYGDPTKQGGYIRGVPTSNMTFISVPPGEIEAALGRAVGSYDEVTWSKTGRVDEAWLINYIIKLNYLTDPNQFDWTLGDPPNWDENDENTVIPVVNPDTGEYYSVLNIPTYHRVLQDLDLSGQDLEDFFGADGYATLEWNTAYDGRYIIGWDYVDNLGANKTFQVGYDLSAFFISGDLWILVKYTIAGETFYWSYLVGSEEDSVLEDMIETDSKDGEYLPVAVLMQDKIWFDADPTSELAITTNKLLKKFSTTGTKIREEFEAEEAENPTEAGEKWDFFVHFAVPIRTTVRGAKEYLHYFFIELENWQQYLSGDYYSYLAGASSQPISELSITEAGITGYNVEYRWSFINTKLEAGEFTWPEAPGGARVLKAKEIAIQIYERTADATEYQVAIDLFWGVGVAIGDYGDPEIAGYHDFVVVTRQNPEDPGNPGVPQGYTRTLIMGLSMQYIINTSDDPVGGFRFRSAIPQLFGTEEETKEFRLPMLWGALKNVPTLHREEAVGAGMCGTVFLVQKIKVKWYQTKFFKAVIVIIAIILIVYAIMNPGFINIARNTIASAIGVTSAASLWIIYTVLQFAVGFIISFASAALGGPLGDLLMIVAAIVFFYSASGGFQTIGQTWSEALANPGWGTALTFLQTVNPLLTAGFQIHNVYTVYRLKDDIEDFIQTAKEKMQELQAAWDALGERGWIDPMDLVRIYQRQGATEYSDSFFARTLNSNPGILGIDLINNYHAMALIPPTELGATSIIDSQMADFENQRG